MSYGTVCLRVGMRILERQDVQEVIGDPLLAEVMRTGVTNARGFSLCTSSGTSGSGPMLVVMSARDTPAWIGGSNRRVTCYGPRSLRLRNTIMMRNDPSSARSSVLNPDPSDLVAGLPALLEDYEPDSVRGGLSFAMRVSDSIPQSKRGNVTTIHVGGEAMTESRMAFLHERFPFARVRAVYIVTELFSAVSLPSCGHTAMNRFHPSDTVSITVLEPDETGVGDLVIEKRRLPGVGTVHYRAGDVGRLCGPCACGEQVTFEVVGRRGHDYVRLAGAVLRREEFDRVLNAVPGVGDYRVEVTEHLINGRMIGHILLRILPTDHTPSDVLKTHIEEQVSDHLFLTPTQTLAQLVSAGYFAPLEIIFASEPFTTKFKDVKIVHRT